MDVRPSAGIIWHGLGSVLKVAGFTLRDPCVYASTRRTIGDQRAADPSEILVASEVRRPRGLPPDTGYWPWYSRIEPEHRYLYLEWLASGKSSLPPLEGLLFLYFYGLERRILVDGQDIVRALREVVRLRKLDEPRRGTRDGGSFRNYSSGLLWFALAKSPELFDARAFVTACKVTDAWSESMIAAPLAWLAQSGRPLPSDLAIRVARINPRAMQSVVTKRVGGQFGELFHRRYVETFGEGLTLKTSKRPRAYVYRPANGALDEMSCMIADPTGAPSQFEPLADLWNGCIEDLRRLSKVSVAAGAPLTPEAWDAMPSELRAGVDHPLASRVHDVLAAARSNSENSGGSTCLVSAGSLASIVGIEPRPRLTRAQGRRVAETVHHAGYGIEPDIRLGARSPGWDDPVAVFLRAGEADVDAARYLGASCVLRLGLTIAEADGTVDPEELRRLSEQIDAVFQLPPHEKQRLEALCAVLLKVGADLGAVSKRLESALSPDARRQVGRLLVAIAAASGSIERKELGALRRCFRALTLPPEVLDQTVAELLPSADSGFVTVQTGSRGTSGETIPGTSGLQLNREAISAIMAETREVAQLLADAMAVDESDDDLAAIADTRAEAVSVAGNAGSPAPPPPTLDEVGPPARYAAFFAELVSRSHWPRQEARDMARKHTVMLAGAIEALNEWSLDRWGVPIIDEGEDTLIVDRSLQ